MILIIDAKKSHTRLEAQNVAGCRPVMIWTCFALVARSLSEVVISLRIFMPQHLSKELGDFFDTLSFLFLTRIGDFFDTFSLFMSQEYLSGKMRNEETRMASPSGRVIPKA